ERGELVGHRGRAGEPDRLADLPHARRVAPPLDEGADDLEHAALARGEAVAPVPLGKLPDLAEGGLGNLSLLGRPLGRRPRRAALTLRRATAHGCPFHSGPPPPRSPPITDSSSSEPRIQTAVRSVIPFCRWAGVESRTDVRS